MDIKEKIKTLPESPGVYIFKDKSGTILYIGKAANLKKRLSSYFMRFLSDKTQRLVSQIADVEYILTPTEAEAQLREARLIKENLPKYNVALRDDKSFPLICITADEYPRIFICRKKKKDFEDKSLYFGPYTNAKLLRQALKTIRKIFPFCTCKKPKESCLYYRLNLCPGPGLSGISKSDYQEIIHNIVLFLEGKQDTLIKKLSDKLKILSEEQKFEEAARLRDQIRALSLLREIRNGEIDFASQAHDLKIRLKLRKLPLRIEAFDISNISGQEACGSMVSFFKGIPDKHNYRRFRIKEVQGIDDYAMLSEVLRRRYSRLKEENKTLPDLILIDGGRTHLLTAQKELEKLGLKVPIISIAKGKENIYTQDEKGPVRLPYSSAALHLIQRIRDEAHRFAIGYHHVLRRKKIIKK